MMTATILAKQADVSLFTVRHYTRIGLLKPIRNLQNNYKVYQPSDAVRVRFIQAAFGFGAASALQFAFQAMGWHAPYQLFLVVPYLLTLAGLAGMVGRTRAPAMLGRTL